MNTPATDEKLDEIIRLMKSLEVGVILISMMLVGIVTYGAI